MNCLQSCQISLSELNWSIVFLICTVKSQIKIRNRDQSGLRLDSQLAKESLFQFEI